MVCDGALWLCGGLLWCVVECEPVLPSVVLVLVFVNVGGLWFVVVLWVVVVCSASGFCGGCDEVCIGRCGS